MLGKGRKFEGIVGFLLALQKFRTFGEVATYTPIARRTMVFPYRFRIRSIAW